MKWTEFVSEHRKIVLDKNHYQVIHYQQNYPAFRPQNLTYLLRIFYVEIDIQRAGRKAHVNLQIPVSEDAFLFPSPGGTWSTRPHLEQAGPSAPVTS